MHIGLSYQFDIGGGTVAEFVYEGIAAPCAKCRLESSTPGKVGVTLHDVGKLENGRGYVVWCYGCDDSRFFFTLDGAVTAVGIPASKFRVRS